MCAHRQGESHTQRGLHKGAVRYPYLLLLLLCTPTTVWPASATEAIIEHRTSYWVAL